jgi:hypothetical protein
MELRGLALLRGVTHSHISTLSSSSNTCVVTVRQVRDGSGRGAQGGWRRGRLVVEVPWRRARGKAATRRPRSRAQDWRSRDEAETMEATVMVRSGDA